MSQPTEVCEACGGEVRPDEAYRAELSVGDLMCPTSMTFHRECYPQASEVWESPPETTCTFDAEYPETQNWPTGRPGEV